MEILYVLLILLLVTRTFGEIAARMGQPNLLGELIGGVALGALFAQLGDVFPPVAGLIDDPVFTALANLGVFFLMLLGGTELRASELAEVSGKSLIIATCGLLFPLAAGFGLAWGFLPDSSYRLAQALFVGTALAITAVPVSIRVLMDLGQLNTIVGRTIVSAAIIDDVLSLILLAFLTGLISTGGFPSVTGLVSILGSVLLFVVITVFVAHWVVPRVRTFVTRWKTAEFEFTSLILAALVFSALAEFLGLHFILGAFVAGLLFERRYAGRSNYEEVKKKVSGVTLGFLAPVFFASIGMHLDLGAITAIPLFVVFLIVVAFVTKLAGAGVPAHLLGLSRRDAWGVGIGMSARGAVELIIADIALQAGLMSHPEPIPPVVGNLFSAIVIMAIVTTLATPFALKRVFAQEPEPVHDASRRTVKSDLRGM